MTLDPKGVFDRIQSLAADAVSDFTTEGTRDPFFKVKADRWPEVAKLLHDDPDLRMDCLQNLTAVDWIKQTRIDVVYHLYSYAHHHAITVKIELPRDNAVVPSVAGIWRAADWNEREQYDLLGVQFTGHPDLRRLLMPDDWVGHPMRKDYQEAASYRGMPTTRASVLDLLAIYDKTPADQRG